MGNPRLPERKLLSDVCLYLISILSEPAHASAVDGAVMKQIKETKTEQRDVVTLRYIEAAALYNVVFFSGRIDCCSKRLAWERKPNIFGFGLTACKTRKMRKISGAVYLVRKLCTL